MQFKKDYKRCLKRGLNVQRLLQIIADLAAEKKLPASNKDHALAGDYAGYRECHIQGDWLLIYKADGDNLILTVTRTGTHSDLLSR
jgi:mRNA interferase YafQ